MHQRSVARPWECTRVNVAKGRQKNGEGHAWADGGGGTHTKVTIHVMPPESCSLGGTMTVGLARGGLGPVAAIRTPRLRSPAVLGEH